MTLALPNVVEVVTGRPPRVQNETVPEAEDRRILPGVPYPVELMDRVVAECGLDGRQRPLDLGCGTMEVFLRLLPHLSSVVAVDPDPDMLERARRKASHRNSSDIRFV
ncbi:MAG: class I SAM-dependent methyltransferase [Rhodobacteraceae bacterium]|nr:class I SAM-dependent methyltransferase [Paracoccaceae bacterium]MCY4140413.1 class I SAM-dependent methyltransferase [Paracoccaceae bacterium]